jgi:hypothetical protein
VGETGGRQEQSCDGSSGYRWSRVIPIAFLGVTLCLLVRPYIDVIRSHGLRGALSYIADAEIYSRTVLAANFYSDGFVRRGLGGTIAKALSGNWNNSIILFIAFSVTWFMVPILSLLKRVAVALNARQAIYFAAVLALSPQTFFGWARDLSRTDLFVAGWLAIAVVAWVDQRRMLAVSAILCGLLVHETAVVFGLPLLAAMLAEDWRAGVLNRQQVTRLTGIAAAGIASIIFLQMGFGVSNLTLANHMLRETPVLTDDPVHRLYRDIAIYMAVAGPDALKTAICYNFEMNKAYWLQFASCLAVLIGYALILPLRRRPTTAFIVMCVPAVFMMLIANDTGRWLKLSVLCGWLISAFYLLRKPEGDSLRNGVIAQGSVILTILLFMGTTKHNNINPMLDRIALSASLGDPVSLRVWMDTCDPGWERYIQTAEVQLQREQGVRR